MCMVLLLFEKAALFQKLKNSQNRLKFGRKNNKLGSKRISHFYEIDCDEIRYFHEGCGLKITDLNDDMRQYLLGCDTFRVLQRQNLNIPGSDRLGAGN